MDRDEIIEMVSFIIVDHLDGDAPWSALSLAAIILNRLDEIGYGSQPNAD